MNLFEGYWNHRYLSGETGWDIGYVSTPLKDYIDQLEDKSIRILIPGAGNAYEAEYLHKNGFTEVTVVDIASIPLMRFKERVPGFPEDNLIQKDFFDLVEPYDLVLEQTFFCALEPELRPAYVRKMHELLSPGGKLVGLLFNVPLFSDHPPFGGSKKEYEPLFGEYFEIDIMEPAYNSIPPRQDNELFIKLRKK